MQISQTAYWVHTQSLSGHSLTSRILVEEFWITRIKKGIQKFVTCIRWNARNRQMDQLPEERVTPSNTFEKVGIGLCGPFTIKASPLRFYRTTKVVNFVCRRRGRCGLTTKRTSLEPIGYFKRHETSCSNNANTRPQCRRQHGNLSLDTVQLVYLSSLMFMELFHKFFKLSVKKCIQELSMHLQNISKACNPFYSKS